MRLLCSSYHLSLLHSSLKLNKQFIFLILLFNFCPVKTVLGAIDTTLLEALYGRGVPVFDMGSHMNETDVGWGSPEFHKMGREKVSLLNEILTFGYEVLLCDTDTVWIKVEIHM